MASAVRGERASRGRCCAVRVVLATVAAAAVAVAVVVIVLIEHRSNSDSSQLRGGGCLMVVLV